MNQHSFKATPAGKVLFSIPGLALAAVLLQGLAASAAEPVQVEVKAHTIPEGPHCVYARLDRLPVEMTAGHIIVNGEVNGTNAPMVVDTGTKFSELSMQEAQKLGLKMTHTKLTETNDAGEREAVYTAFVDEVALGNNAWRSNRIQVSRSLGDSTVALAGADVLLNGYHRDVEFSLATNDIKFFVPHGCDKAFLGYWDDNASAVPLQTWSPQDPRQMVTVEVNGHSMTALIDSGSPNSVLDLEAAKRLGITPQSAGVTEVAGKGSARASDGKQWSARFSSFAIGGEFINQPRIEIADLWGSVPAAAQSELQSGLRMMMIGQSMGPKGSVSTADLVRPKKAEIIDAERPDMVLGADFLRAHRVLLALSQQRMYFSYVGGRVFGGEGAKESAAPQS